MGEHENTVYFIAWVFGHVASFGAVVFTLGGYLPPLAAFVALAWYFIQIAESETFRNMLKRRRERRIERLKKKLHDLERPRP